MNYKAIHTTLIEKSDVDAVSKTRKFYRYLLDNNVAYYYAKVISSKTNDPERKIFHAAEKFNKKYKKTLKLIFKITKEESIDFLLFKTFKYLPESVDGDIDLFIREKYLQKFVSALQNSGFSCVWENRLKASCIKEGFCKIEPRVTMDFHGKTIFKESVIWHSNEKEHIFGMDILRTSKAFDLCYFLLNTLYGPNYIRLYHYLLLKSIDREQIYTLANEAFVKDDVQLVLQYVEREDNIRNRFPLFMSNISFLEWWIARLLFNKGMKIQTKIKNLVFFFYAKYGYVFFNRLPFRHDWNIPSL